MVGLSYKQRYISLKLANKVHILPEFKNNPEAMNYVYCIFLMFYLFQIQRSDYISWQHFHSSQFEMENAEFDIAFFWPILVALNLQLNTIRCISTKYDISNLPLTCSQTPSDPTLMYLFEQCYGMFS